MITINSDVFLANALIDRSSISIRKIKEIIDKIYKIAEHKKISLYIDVTLNNLIWVTQDKRPDLFSWTRDGIITRKKELGF